MALQPTLFEPPQTSKVSFFRAGVSEGGLIASLSLSNRRAAAVQIARGRAEAASSGIDAGTGLVMCSSKTT